MMRLLVFICVVGAGVSSAAASPMSGKVPFAIEEGLACSALLNEAAKASRPTMPYGPDDAHESAFWGYSIGSAVLAKRSGKGPKFVDEQVERRGAAVRAMLPGARKAATVKCVADFARYQVSAKPRR